jgi:hypothetical protein
MNNLSEEFVEISKGFFSLFNLNKTKRRWNYEKEKTKTNRPKNYRGSSICRRPL